MNRKGVSLPSSSEETKKNKRENLEQKQILVPELCSIHPFPATLWRQTVSLPCIFYRLNGLLIADQLRALIAREMHIGLPVVPKGFKWEPLSFGWTLSDVLENRDAQSQQQHSNNQKAKTNRKNMQQNFGGKMRHLKDLDNKLKSDKTDLEELSELLADKIKLENQKIKKKSLEIGTWSNEMASNLDDSAGEDGDVEDDELDELFDPNIALPDNLTILGAGSSGSLVSAVGKGKGGGRDWGTGIEQKPFRVASPTMFDNPNINIPGAMDDEFFSDYFDSDALATESDDLLSDVDDEAKTKKKKKGKKGQGGNSCDEEEVSDGALGESGVTRIEFRGNQVLQKTLNCFIYFVVLYLFIFSG